ncbi:MAG: putative glycolipid-binding domain-containing protein [Actinobacteria bacterium]|nr:putative glycolipid-binding domain-containing protein [Actinomycetota bacterium]
MTNDHVEHHIVWHCALLASSEHGSLLESEDGYRLHGVVVLPLGDVPCHIHYDVILDREWRPTEARATVATPPGVREIALQSEHSHRWQRAGVPASHLDGCTDVDLGWSPATNTVPIRRLGLEIGESATITAAWIRFPELDVLRDEQRYTRLAIDRWRYQSGDYDFELVTDPTTGLVLSYGDDLWRAAATATAPAGTDNAKLL